MPQHIRVVKRCVVCRSEFNPGLGGAITCSPVCRKARADWVSKESARRLLGVSVRKCDICGTSFDVIGNPSKRTCSDKCRDEKLSRRMYRYRRSPKVLAYESVNAERKRIRNRERRRQILRESGATPAWILIAHSAIKAEYHSELKAFGRTEWRETDFPELKERKECTERDRERARIRMLQPRERIKATLRLRIRKTLRGQIKHGRTMELVGCTRDFLIKWIEAKWKRGMTWQNYASHWVIDHIIPCASFDLSTREGQQRCFHYSNLRPLERMENARKSDLIITTQPELPITLGI